MSPLQSFDLDPEELGGLHHVVHDAHGASTPSALLGLEARERCMRGPYDGNRRAGRVSCRKERESCSLTMTHSRA